MDNDLYIDVRNRMQSLLARPDVEALMTSSQESVNAAAANSLIASGEADNNGANEEQKTTASTVVVK